MCDNQTHKAVRLFPRNNRWTGPSSSLEDRSKCMNMRLRLPPDIVIRQSRETFFKRLRINRSRSVDRFRQIVENYGEFMNYRSISHLKTILESDLEAATLMTDVDVNDVLNDIERELAQVDLQDEAAKYELDVQSQTQDIVNRLLPVCKVCLRENTEGDICGLCATSLDSEFTK
ncbi:uncharacterized protein LOC126878640 [Diabrotica virgifera virgifera]|uniref:Uncharacterized protein LOC114342121 n=1 Tax=Diabrotica virgifera virgifera TaxID=50390 RepID=A0A6P7GTM6_DIAVI|nr:uncharacterized protein LOC126878640 [Diabrotica virgifera virgifera]XP_050497426.1 uncharacterized protein LOC126878640 [Diabrotica virgifera virgifera]